MTDSAKSFLVFNDYEVQDMKFKRNYEYKNDSEIELNFDIGGNAQMDIDKNEAAIIITCKIFETEFEQGNAPFYLEISMGGHFQIEVSKKDEFDIKDFQLNGMAILFPYMRSIITSFTSQAGIPPVILPPINVYKALESIKDD